jgi:hypothetical protein
MPVKGFRHSVESRQQMSKSHTGLKFSEPHKNNHLKAVRKATSKTDYREQMSKIKSGTVFALDSLNGASEKNKNAKDWWFIHNQVNYKFRSLNKFVRDHKHLFSEDELTEYKTEGRAAKVYRATVMLRNLLRVKKDGSPVVPNHEWNGWTIGEKWEQGFYDLIHLKTEDSDQ